MDISPIEARDALREVAQTSSRSLQSRGYRASAPHLLLWGVIWMIGYAAPVVFSGLGEGWCWMVLDIVGIAGSSVIAAHTPVPTDQSRGKLARLWGGLVIVMVFVVATLAVMHPTQAAQYRVFPALVLGLVYGLFGVIVLPKFLWVACGVSLLSLMAYFFLQPYLSVCVAVIGGGGLVIGGMWMRRL